MDNPDKNDLFYKAGFNAGREKLIYDAEKKRTIPVIWVIVVCIFIIELYALKQGINGKALITSMVLLGALGGAKVQKLVGKFFKE